MMRVEVTQLLNGFCFWAVHQGKQFGSREEDVVISSLRDDPVVDLILALGEVVTLMKSGGLDPVHNFIF